MSVPIISPSLSVKRVPPDSRIPGTTTSTPLHRPDSNEASGALTVVSAQPDVGRLVRYDSRRMYDCRGSVLSKPLTTAPVLRDPIRSMR